MCCIFTVCGWMIDLIQRLWTFTMSCCISSAVCCVLITAALSGIALGYNYSLAEYIDLKETNVSVYLKRGVFDDEVIDDMEWRRSGHQPVAGHIRDSNLKTGEDPDKQDVPIQSGRRRLEDSVLESEDKNKFEGSLMKLTAKPPDAVSVNPPVTADDQLREIMEKYPMGSLDQMKAVQGLINMRKLNNARSSTKNALMFSDTDKSNVIDPLSGRRYMPPMESNLRQFVNSKLMPEDPTSYRYLNPARLAVPDPSFAHMANWLYPKAPEQFMPPVFGDKDADVPEYPKPIPLNVGPVRPTPSLTTKELPMPRFKLFTQTRSLSRTSAMPVTEDVEPPDEPIEKFRPRNKNELEMPSNQNEEVIKGKHNKAEDYIIDAQGAPVRRRRLEPIINLMKHSAPGSFKAKNIEIDNGIYYDNI